MKKFYPLLFLCLLATSLFAAEGDEEPVPPAPDQELAEVPPAPEQELADGEVAVGEHLGPAGAGYVMEQNFGPERDQGLVDTKVLRDYIESRGLIRSRRCEGTLTIAADVRARWTRATEVVNGEEFRGWKPDNITAANIFRSEFNLMMDYVTPTPNTWVSTRVRWATIDGVDGGLGAIKTELDRAFLGYDIYSKGDMDLYIEAGRSRLNYIFDSRVEFSAIFDGIHLYYTNCLGKIGEFVVHGGPFVIDATSNHYAWVVETGLSRIAKTGLSFKYSIVDWLRSAPTFYYGNLKKGELGFETDAQFDNFSIRNNPRYQFVVSQFLVGYEFTTPDCLWKKYCNPYAAFLVNTAASKHKIYRNKKENLAWYAGFTLGKLCKAGDWSIDFNYQWVEAQSVPEFDLSGFGHGNAENLLFTDAIIASQREGGRKFKLGDIRGFTNYKGWQITALYAFSESLSLRAQAINSKPIDRSIGGNFSYRSFDLTAIYAF